MKKLNLIMICLMVSLFASAQTIEKTYYFGQPNISQIQGYEQIQFADCMQSALAGQPSLPWHSVSLMLPQGTEAVAIEVELSDFQTLEGSHNLYPYQTALTYSNPVRRQFEKDEALYASKSVYPAQVYGNLSTHYMNGVGFAFSAFTPVQYVPGTGEVRYATKATVRITTAASKTDQSRKLWLNSDNAQRATRLAQNPEMLQTYDSRGRIVGGYDLLVVTTQQWASAFDEYVAFYQARGLRTRVIDLETILNTIEGRDNAEKLRNYIIQEYEENGIMMVNLAGDVPDIPYRGFYCDVLSGGSHMTDSDIPADLYFASLDGTWNDDNDNRWGEIDEDDLLPEIGIGRMCFSNQNELENMLHKSMTYQTEPVLGEFQKVIMAGEHLYDNPLSNGSQYLELLIGTHDDNGYTTTGIPEDYEFTRLYEEEGNWSGTLLRNAINQGTQYVHHDGHANTNYVAGWSNSDITNNNFSGVNGVDHNYTFFHTSGCICGDFASDCILERMTKIANFAVATFGNSRYGWFNEGQTEGPAIHLHRETEDAYYHDRIPYGGMALREGKIETAPWVNAPGQWEEGALRWNFYDLNMMGDVACSPWHDEPFVPEVEYNAEILVGLASMDVAVTNNGDGLKNFRCALFHGEDMIGVGYTDEDGNVTIEFTEPLDFVGEMSLIVTGCDAWPQSYPIITLPGDCAYIVYNDYEISNGAQPDFGQSIALDMQIKNVGTVTANNVTATLSTDCDYITLTDATETIATIVGGETLTLEQAFAMDIADNVPNMMKADFELTCTDGTDIWESKFSIRLYAPEFAVLGTVIEDGDGQIDPGETVTAHITVKNAGMAAAPDTRLNINCNLPEITFEQSEFQIGTVAPEDEFTVDFVFTLSDEAPLGVAYEIGFTATSGNYTTEGSFVFSVGTVVEEWETGDFSKFEWENDPTKPWTIVTENPYEGSYCAKSGSIGDNMSSVLSITLDVHSEGEVSFYRKVSSEEGYDALYFTIDTDLKGEWSGEVPWGQVSYTITPGQHQLYWAYNKDVYVSNGSDCAWLDNIVFPPAETITITQETVVNGLTLYPNPNKGQFSINLPEEECEIVVFNNLGQQVYQQRNAKGLTTLKLEGLNSGMYFVTVKSANVVSTIKFVKE
jgi:flagellar hook protein FlgE